MYTYSSRVRYSETDINGRLSLYSLLNYFQDCSTFHSEEIGLGYKYLLEKNLLWVMSAWQIVVNRYPDLCENIIVGTAPYDFRSVIGYRNFWLDTETGERLACANSVWTLIDTAKGRPVKPSAEIVNGYALAEKIPMDYADRKITIPIRGTALSPIEVKAHHLDTNHHVNNGKYVSIAMDLLEKPDCDICQLRAEYRKSALLGDIMYPEIINTENTSIVILADKEGNPYCISEFTTK
ncbi:MAG: thioesterase [Lachnospiraceae bacterium]|nr:thioesterase [Lachnospiraceae bacterium]